MDVLATFNQNGDMIILGRMNLKRLVKNNFEMMKI